VTPRKSPAEEAACGFLLQPTYRIEGGRPVVHLYGTLETGESFLVRDDRWTPHFYVARSDAPSARDLGAKVVGDPGTEATRNMAGEPLARVEVPTPPDTPAVRDRLQGAGIRTYEADVRFAYRYLIDRGIRGALAVRGSWSPGPRGIDRAYENPDVAPGACQPDLGVLSLDIETDPRARRLLSIALVGTGPAETDEVLLFSPPQFPDCPGGATAFATEAELLGAFVERVRALDPDILTGWNVVDFDLSVLARLAETLGVPLLLGRGGQPVRFRPSNFPGAPTQVTVPGRVVLDGIQLLRGAFVRLESYALNDVGRVILGRGKTVEDREGGREILRLFQEDREALVAYNRNDARLVLDILEELRLLELTVERSLLTGMPPDRVSASIAAFDFLYLSELHKLGIAGPTVTGPVSADVGTPGGHVLEPRPGLHRDVAVFDFKSLYPSLIRTFQIDPLGYARATAGKREEEGPGAGGIRAPNGAVFPREPGILPRLLDELVPRREKAKREGNAVASQAIKILMNSFYGVLGTSACRFADPALAGAITGFGKEILLWSKRWIEGEGYEVLYGDTDSLFVSTGAKGPEEAMSTGERLAAALNEALAVHVRETWDVESRLEIEFERLYLRLFLPRVRHGTEGARKRYAGLAREGNRERVVFTGMEVVRRDWTDLARTVQRELYERLFTDRPVDAYLREIVRALRAGELNAQLVYRKALRKAADSYTATTPPHVAAARKLAERRKRSGGTVEGSALPRGTVIAYVITTAGPEPVEENGGCGEGAGARTGAPLDYQHYVEKQVEPVAAPVLDVLGLDFKQVIGDDRQTTLF